MIWWLKWEIKFDSLILCAFKELYFESQRTWCIKEFVHLGDSFICKEGDGFAFGKYIFVYWRLHSIEFCSTQWDITNQMC